MAGLFGQVAAANGRDGFLLHVDHAVVVLELAAR
jgi:hypothetical protein